MTKEDIRKALREGRDFTTVFPFQKDGQKCLIYKAPWPDNNTAADMDDIIYVPDIYLNEISDITEKKNLKEEDKTQNEICAQ